MRRNSLILVLLFIIAVSACKEPVKDYSYINLDRLKGWEGSDPITLTFEMRDTISPCELYFVGEIAVMRGSGSEKGYPVNIIFVSPDNCRYIDTLTLPVNVRRESGISKVTGGVTEIQWPYRKNIYNKKPGEWSVILTKGDKDVDYGDIIGLGIHCKQNRL